MTETEAIEHLNQVNKLREDFNLIFAKEVEAPLRRYGASEQEISAVRHSTWKQYFQEHEVKP